MTKVTTTDVEGQMKAAKDLKPGDLIAAGFLPSLQPATVLLAVTYGADHEPWTFLVHRHAADEPLVDYFLADALIPLESVADASGMSYSREADDPTPVSPDRVPLHTGGEGGDW